MASKSNQKVFHVGDTVEWTSQAGGYSKTKKGKVIAVIPPNVDPFRMELDGKHYVLPDGQRIPYNSTTFGGGMARNHESYVVSVNDGKAYYWPRVSSLN